MSCGCGAGCAAGACSAGAAAAGAMVLMNSEERTKLNKQEREQFKAKALKVKAEAEAFSKEHNEFMGYSLRGDSVIGDGVYEGDDYAYVLYVGVKPGESWSPRNDSLKDNEDGDGIYTEIRKFEAKGKWGKRFARIFGV